MAEAAATMKQVFTGDPAQLLNAYKQLAAENVKLEMANQKLAQTTKQTADDGLRGQKLVEDAVSRASRAVLASVASWVSVQTIIQGINKDLEDYQRNSQLAANVQVSAGRAQADVLKNLVGGTQAERRAYLESIARIQAETGFADVNQLYAAAAGGLSAGGERGQVLAAVRQAALVSPFNPEELQTLVESQLHLGRATGVQDPQQLLGFLLAAQAASPIASLEQTARNLSPAVLSSLATVRGDPRQAAREAGALFATLSQFGGDLRGESTRTAQIAFTTQLEEFFTEGATTGTGRGKRTIKPEMDPGTISGRVAILQASQELQDAFLSEATFETQFMKPIELLVRGGRTASGASPGEFFRESVGTIDFDKGAVRRLQEENRGLTQQLATASVVSSAKAAEEQLDFGGASADAIARAVLFGGELGDQKLEGAIPRTRRHSLIPFGFRNLVERPYHAAHMNLAADPVREAIDLLRERQFEIQFDVSRMTTRDPSELRGQEKVDFEFLGRQIQTLTRVMERSATATEEMNARDKQPKPGAAPAANAERGRHRER